MKALIIREPWIGLILSGAKDWEMRRRAVRHRGPIALIRGGSGLVVGTARLVDVLAELTVAQLAATQHHHGIPAVEQAAAFAAGWRVPWLLSHGCPLHQPVAYRHPQGAVTWVNLSPEEAQRVRDAAG